MVSIHENFNPDYFSIRFSHFEVFCFVLLFFAVVIFGLGYLVRKFVERRD